MTGSGDDRDDVWEPFADDDGDRTDGDSREHSKGSDSSDGPPATGSDDAMTDSNHDPTRSDDATTDSSSEAAGPEGSNDAGPSAGDDDGGGLKPPSADPDDAPSPEPAAESDDYDNPVAWFFGTDQAVVASVREVLSSVAMVGVVAVLLFAISGLWPPLVAIESGSMEPHMYKGDLVFVVDNGRFAPDGNHEGVVTYRQGNPELEGAGADDALEGYWSFGNHGNVIVFEPDGQEGTPIIHRAHIYVEEDENWYDEANPEYIGSADSCEELTNCPADYDGYITKGDNNPRYDQVGPNPRSDVVKPEWVQGVAKVRVPWLGCIRLQLSGTPCF